MLTKVCRRCGETKDLKKFSKHARHSDGYKAYCKPCYRYLTSLYRNFRKAYQQELRRIREKNYIRRFWGFVDKGEENKCWEWTSVKTNGYGRFRYQGKMVRAHRYIYEQLIGAIPSGKTLDHLCRNPSCVNPKHLEPVSIKINTLRGNSPPAKNARKTHCKWGHEFSGKNLYIPPSGNSRYCRTCLRNRKKKNNSISSNYA